MEKIKCDIIQDLIPSYVDGICSEATRECVEEHMESCEECRKMAALCRENEFSGERMEQKELNGLKKIRQLIKYKGIACGGLVVFILGYMGLSILVDLDVGYISWSAFSVMSIVSICLVLLSGMGFKGKKAPGWPEVISGGVSVAIALAVILLNLYFIGELQSGAEHIFGRELFRTGPFLSRLMGVAYFVMLGFFLYHLICIIRQDKNGNWLMCLDVTGCYIVAACNNILSNMVVPWTLMQILVKEIGVIAAIGLLGTVVSVLIGKVSRKKAAGVDAQG